VPAQKISQVHSELIIELTRIAHASCGRAQEHAVELSYDRATDTWQGWAGWAVQLSRSIDTTRWAYVRVAGCDDADHAYACLLGAAVDEHEKQREASGVRSMSTADTWPNLTPVGV
jgi:hypothetical protein